MNKVSNKGLNLLFILQGIFLFGLGVFGNKLAEIVNISPNIVLFYTIVFMTASLVVTIGLSRYQNRNEITAIQEQPSQTVSWSDRFAKVLLNRIATIFPLGVVAGIITAFLFINLMPQGQVFFIPQVGAHYYEIISYLIAAVTLFMISRKRPHFPLVISYAIGFALSISIVILLLHPSENVALFTFSGWAAIIFITAIIMRSQTADGLYKDIKALIQNLTKERSS